MNDLTSNNRKFFSGTLEAFHLKTVALLAAFFERNSGHVKEVPAYLLQHVTALAHSLTYAHDDEQCRNLLLRLYELVVQQGPEMENAGEVHEYEIHRLRFLVIYAALCDSAVTEKVETATQRFFRQIAGIDKFSIQADSKPLYRDSRTPDYLQYDYLMLLVDLWRFRRNSEAYDRLKLYCALETQGAPYYEICGRHRLIGVFSILPAPFQEMSKDILLQNLFRGNYLEATLKNDPWRFMEQICLYQLFHPDVTVHRFVTALLVQLIEGHNRSERYADIGLFADQNTPALINALLLYVKLSDVQTCSEQYLSADSGKTIWDTDTVLKITASKLLPEMSRSTQYSMGTFIFDQITPGALFFSPDNNWRRKYHYGRVAESKPFYLGATAVMASKPPENRSDTQQFLLARNTFSAMVKLAIENRTRYKGKVIGVTGSVGKTTTASMIHEILSHFGRSYKNLHYFNHQVGVPKSVANIPQESDYAILEMGMGQPGTILPKSCLVRPHIVIVTEIQHDHMEFHDSINSVIETKLEIADGLEPGGLVILNRDSKHFAHMLGILHAKGVCRVLTFGEHPLSDIRALSVQLHEECSDIAVDIKGRRFQDKFSLAGIHMALNSLAVLAVLYELGVDLEKALLQFQTLLPASGRNEIFEVTFEKGKSVQVVDDTFNANPASMRSSFHLLSLMQPKNGGRRIMVVGDMGELGEKTREYHEALADDLNRSKIDIVYSVGEYTRYLDRRINNKIEHQHFSNSKILQKVLMETLQDGDIVSCKGSARRGFANAGAVADITKHFKKIKASPGQSAGP